MPEHTQVVPASSLANKSRALTVIQNAAVKRREVLLARIKPLQDELKQLDAILATGNPEAATDTSNETIAE
jgi:formiminotetrahydrofolate cyclodeaminase